MADSTKNSTESDTGSSSPPADGISAKVASADVSPATPNADDAVLQRHRALFKEREDAHTLLLARYEELHKLADQREKEHLEGLARAQKNFREHVEQLRHRVDGDIKKREEALAEREATLDAKEKELTQKLAVLEQERGDVQALRQQVEAHINARVEREAGAAQQEVAHLRADKQALLEKYEETRSQLRTREIEEASGGGPDPKLLREANEKLGKKVKELENQLANRLSADDSEELTLLRQHHDQWERDRRALVADVGRLQSELDRRHVDVGGYESLRDRNKALELNQSLLKKYLEELQANVEGQLANRDAKPVFPELIAIDGHADFQRQVAGLVAGDTRDGIDLSEFVEDLRHRIGGRLNEGQDKLFYTERDVRSFVAGLSMSRLHLLQGISGIGKSSLPRAFADAVGGRCETVTVQAGWRDRNDLFGYYNAFEKTYRSTAFSQAVYAAQTPLWRDRIVIVLLDEMNLSHPEQYAADILDVLERPDVDSRRFELMTTQPGGTLPTLLKEGRFLQLPENVWFVGTANHDETTKDFADKTYDRSFVLDLPNQPKPFPLTKLAPRKPVSCSAFVKACGLAEKQHQADANKARKWLDDVLRDPLADRFSVGWGGRLESQLKRYVPVVVAAGGSYGEALDLLISTRVLRKIRGRHDNQREDLEHLRNEIEHNWDDRDYPRPEATFAVIDHELRRL
jgi:hypothetical protein